MRGRCQRGRCLDREGISPRSRAKGEGGEEGGRGGREAW